MCLILRRSEKRGNYLALKYAFEDGVLKITIAF
jgi:hypothetical protein